MAELRKQCHFDEQTKVVLFAGRLRRDKGVVKLVEALVALQTIFPNVVLEALAMMLPVITTDAVGAVDSVVDGETGFIVSVRNLEELEK